MNHDPARARFFIIQAARLSGVVLTLLGMAIWRGDLVEPGGSPVVGGVIIVAGLIDLVLVPKVLARRWRSPE